LADEGRAWSTTVSLLEGRHDLTATATDAAGHVSLPAAVTVVVDRTPPSVTTRVPAPGAVNVWSRDGIVATISEALSAASISDAAVQFACTRPDQTTVIVAKTLSLTQESGTGAWTLSIKPLSLPPVPSTCVISLSTALTDLAGNALRVPADAWSWTLPAWQDLGAVVDSNSNWHPTAFHVSFRADGTPVVAISAITFMVYGWVPANGTWTGLSAPTAASYCNSVSLIDDRAGTIWASWSEEVGGAWAAGWDGLNWGVSSPLDFVSSTGAYDATIMLDGSGAPVVAWSEVSGADRRVYARRRAAAQWQLLGSDAVSPAGNTASGVSLGLDGQARVLVSWISTNTSGIRSFQYATWGGSSWGCSGSCGGSVQSAITGGQVLVPPSGSAYLGWIDTGVTPNLARVWRYGSNGFVAFGVEAAMNADSAMAAKDFAFALDESGAPVFAWIEATAIGGASLYVKRWTGSDWAMLGGDAAAGTNTIEAPDNLVLGLGKNGLVGVAWESSGKAADPHRIVVRRFNR
jgi:hypothetical protein